MLVLSRRKDETIMIGDDVEITIVDVRGDTVRLGIKAPRSVSVHRKEIYDAIQAENIAAAKGSIPDESAVDGLGSLLAGAPSLRPSGLEKLTGGKAPSLPHSSALDKLSGGKASPPASGLGALSAGAVGPAPEPPPQGLDKLISNIRPPSRKSSRRIRKDTDK